MQQRIKWHLEHSRNCGCREIPEKIIQEMERLKLEIPPNTAKHL